MATPNPIDTRGATQTSEGEEDATSINSITNLNIPALIIPDLNNTPLEEAIKDGMKVGPSRVPDQHTTTEGTHWSRTPEGIPTLRPVGKPIPSGRLNSSQTARTAHSRRKYW